MTDENLLEKVLEEHGSGEPGVTLAWLVATSKNIDAMNQTNKRLENANTDLLQRVALLEQKITALEGAPPAVPSIPPGYNGGSTVKE